MLPPDNPTGVPPRDAPQPVHRRAFSALEPLVLPSRPTSEGLIKMAKHLNAPRAIEPPVVTQPAPHHRVGKSRQILQALVVPGGCHPPIADGLADRSEEHTSELQSLRHLVCRLLLEKKKIQR